MTDQDLGERATLVIDPSWEHSDLWAHPFGTILRFTYLDFESGIGESVTPEYSDIAIVGRAEPFKTFGGLPSREISVTFRFQNQEGDFQNEVVLPARFLDALKYPVYDAQQDVSYEPPPCILKIGSLFVGRVLLVGGDIHWGGNGAGFDVDTLLPHYAEFQATFAVVRKYQLDLSYRFDGQWQ